MSNIAIIIVAYGNDEWNYLSITEQSYPSIIIVDNTPGRDLNIVDKNIHYIALKENKGIATAQNIGIQKARELGCEFVIFFDQDSEIHATFPNQITDEYKRIEAVYPNLFILGPTVINGRCGIEYKSEVHTFIVQNGFSKRLDVISSGSCVRLNKITDVGELDNSLFIDLVDQEWCWRAASKGYVNGITSNVFLTHYVGNKLVKFGPFQFIISSPFRYYYQTRNWLWMLRRHYVPKQWKFNSIIKHLIYPPFYPFVTTTWKDIYKEMLRGFKDGLFQRYKSLFN